MTVSSDAATAGAPPARPLGLGLLGPLLAAAALLLGVAGAGAQQQHQQTATDSVGPNSTETLFFDPSAPVHGCASSNGTLTLEPASPFLLEDVDTAYDSVTLLLRPMVPSSEGGDGTRMCVLHRWTMSLEDKDAGRGFYFPLGRSVPGIPTELPNGESFRRRLFVPWDDGGGQGLILGYETRANA